MANPQPTLLRLWRARMRSAVKAYLVAKDNLDTLADTEDGDAYETARDKERLLRGIVRGMATMYLVLADPANANNKVALSDLEIDFGMPGKRSKPKPGTSDTFLRWYKEYYGEEL